MEPGILSGLGREGTWVHQHCLPLAQEVGRAAVASLATHLPSRRRRNKGVSRLCSGQKRAKCNLSWKRLGSFMKTYYDLDGLNVVLKANTSQTILVKNMWRQVLGSFKEEFSN